MAFSATILHANYGREQALMTTPFLNSSTMLGKLPLSQEAYALFDMDWYTIRLSLGS